MYFVINTQPILLSLLSYFTTQPDNTGDLTALSFSLSLAELGGEVAEVESGLTREDRMTARIIKNVLPLPSPEGIAAILPSFASNKSLITWSRAPDKSRLPTGGDIMRLDTARPISV